MRVVSIKVDLSTVIFSSTSLHFHNVVMGPFSGVLITACVSNLVKLGATQPSALQKSLHRAQAVQGKVGHKFPLLESEVDPSMADSKDACFLC